MFKWLTSKISNKEEAVHAEQSKVVPTSLTHKERLIAILISYHTGKISIDQAINLIYIWRLTKK